MTPLFETELLKIVEEYQGALSRSQHHDASDILNISQVAALRTRCTSAIERIAGRQSQYAEQASQAISRDNNDHDYAKLARVVGVADALLHDLRQGFTQSLEELLHGDVFSDFIEMAGHLADSGYKDAAGVIAGSTLEAHLRQLATKFGIEVEHEGRPVKADALNSSLTKKKAYSKLDQKGVTAWLGLRNNAAHGNYTEYDKSQVVLMLNGVRDFISRNPA